MSHTPGPWEVAENLFGSTASYEVYANVGTKSGKGGYARICQITPRDQKSNASLIAAAPEMLEALEAVEIAVTLGNAADDDPDAAREWLQAQTKVVELVEAVLKKVRGRR